MSQDKDAIDNEVLEPGLETGAATEDDEVLIESPIDYDESTYQSGVSQEDYHEEEQTRNAEVSEISNNLDGIKNRIADAENSSEDLEDDALRYYVPGDHDSYYANHQPSVEMLENIEGGLDALDDEAAREFAIRQGLESTIRENARLSEAIREANKAKIIALMISGLLSLLLIAMVWAFTQYPKNRYIPTKDNTAICNVDAFTNPSITDSTIADFAKQAVLDLYTFDYINYPDQTETTLSRYFTSQGRVDAVRAFDASGLLVHVAEQALTLKAGARHAPRIEEKGITNDGAPFWVVRFPMVLDIYSGAKTPKESQRHIVTVRLRADTASAANPTGLGILSVNMVPDNGPDR